MSNVTLDLYFNNTKKLDNYSPLINPSMFYYVNLHGLQLTIDFVRNSKKAYFVKSCGWIPPKFVDKVHLNRLTWNALDNYGSLNEALAVFYECLHDLLLISESEVRPCNV